MVAICIIAMSTILCVPKVRGDSSKDSSSIARKHPPISSGNIRRVSGDFPSSSESTVEMSNISDALDSLTGGDLQTAAGHEKKYMLVKKKPKHKKIKMEVLEPKMKYKKIKMKVPVKMMKKKKVKGYLVKKHHHHHEH